jgi:hypothetical protein
VQFRWSVGATRARHTSLSSLIQLERARPQRRYQRNPSHAIHTPVLRCKRILVDSRTNRRSEVRNLDSRTHRTNRRLMQV